MLTQAMGCGKTHDMLALGLLARTPALRTQVVPDLGAHAKVPAVRVIGFTGRESDEPLGIWGPRRAARQQKES